MFLFLVVKRLYLIVVVVVAVVVVVKRLYLITPVLSLLHLGYFIPVIIIFTNLVCNYRSIAVLKNILMLI